MRIKQWLTLIGLMSGLITMPYVLLAAEGDWSVKSDIQGLYGSYSGSTNRSSISSAGLIVSADYLEQGGFSLGGSYTKLNFNVGNDINQQSVYSSLRYNLYLDSLPGTLTLRVDGHGINNNDVTGNTDNVRVIVPQLSFMNYDKSLYVDFGYAYSAYQNNLKVHQFTPTLGFGFNQGADWIQIRGFYVDPSNPLRAQNKNSTMAVEAKLTHWFVPGSWHGLEFARISGMGGERIYAVDHDASAVYNLADIQQGSASLALQWQLANSSHLMLGGGFERYLNNLSADSYGSRFIYLNISSRW